jgi:hypothetical protein
MIHALQRHTVRDDLAELEWRMVSFRDLGRPPPLKSSPNPGKSSMGAGAGVAPDEEEEEGEEDDEDEDVGAGSGDDDDEVEDEDGEGGVGGDPTERARPLPAWAMTDAARAPARLGMPGARLNPFDFVDLRYGSLGS